MSGKRTRPPVHPGQVLRGLFMEPLSLDQHQPAEALDVDPERMSGILTGEEGITADMALSAPFRKCGSGLPGAE
ncbi:MAG: HigA family addiction module antitoxin [Thermodesulfobacteriota bacterium]